MSFPILGLHHVTATVNDAQRDLNFARSALGLRLVKKTVNFDNHGVYHFYYGDELGTPGTIWTTFPYKGMGVPAGTIGTGQVTATAFSVPPGSIEFWESRLKGHNVATGRAGSGFGEDCLTIADPSGLAIQLVEAEEDDRSPWIPGSDDIDVSNAIRGLHSVTMTVRNSENSIEFMRDLLGFEVVNRSGDRTRVAVRGSRTEPGKIIDLLQSPDSPPARNGLGTVHHVAMAIEDPDEHRRLRDTLTGRGIQVTPVMDRQYFQSIYFREPGGILFEVATMRPGFTADESLEKLGRDLKLPPSAESRRAEIEKNLPVVKY